MTFIQDDIDAADRFERAFSGTVEEATAALHDAVLMAVGPVECKACREPWVGKMLFHKKTCWALKAKLVQEAWDAARR